MAGKSSRSFSWLIEAFANGSEEARKHFIELAHLRPKLIAPLIPELESLLNSSKSSVQKASVEMLAILSKVSPAAMAVVIPTLHNILSNEPQNAVANHAIEILTNYGRTSKEAAQKVIPVLKKNVKKLKPVSVERISRAVQELSNS